jgi:hypothetical protein
MKGGVNIWVALRDTQDSHRAWLHIDRPYTPEDLPRAIDEAPREKRGSEAAGTAADVVADASCKARRDQAAAGAANGAANGAAAGKPKQKSAIEKAIELESRHEAKDFGGVVML